MHVTFPQSDIAEVYWMYMGPSNTWMLGPGCVSNRWQSPRLLRKSASIFVQLTSTISDVWRIHYTISPSFPDLDASSVLSDCLQSPQALNTLTPLCGIYPWCLRCGRLFVSGSFLASKTPLWWPGIPKVPFRLVMSRSGSSVEQSGDLKDWAYLAQRCEGKTDNHDRDLWTIRSSVLFYMLCSSLVSISGFPCEYPHVDSAND
jgi:hypothetical protein